MVEDKRILVTRSSMPPFEEYCAEIVPLWESHWLTNRGVKHKELEKSLQEYLGADYVTLFVNGHSALECVLETMELGRDGRDEVITTPLPSPLRLMPSCARGSSRYSPTSSLTTMPLILTR